MDPVKNETAIEKWWRIGSRFAEEILRNRATSSILVGKQKHLLGTVHGYLMLLLPQ